MNFDVTILGGGIVGLATCYKLLSQNINLNVLIVEKENDICLHQSGNNSGVIHSGIYYKTNSLKAKNCIEGYKELIDFSNRFSIPYKITGKIIVATEKKEIDKLEKIYLQGINNGLENIRRINQKEIKEIEPNCNGIEGIFVPQTGIIHYPNVGKTLLQEIKRMGGQINLNSKVLTFKKINGNIIIKTSYGEFRSKLVVNCTGLYSDRIYSEFGIKLDYKIIPFRGEYYKVIDSKKELVKNLIYPVPDPDFPFLGVHFTRDIFGGLEAGPNAVLAFKREGYKFNQINFKDLFEIITYTGFQKLVYKYGKRGFDEIKRSLSKKLFLKSLQKLVPDIKEEDIIRTNSGIRAQAIKEDGSLIDDFLIQENNNFINIGNAPSPAATSSLSIGKYITDIIIKKI